MTHRSLSLKLQVLLKLFFPKIKMMTFVHTFMDYPKRDFIHRWFYSKMHLFVVFSNMQKVNLVDYLGLRPERVKVIPHAVDSTVFSAGDRMVFRKKLGLNSEDFLIGVVGRFDKKKGQLEMIRAAALLKRDNIKFKLVFVGADTMFEEGISLDCRRAVQKLGLNQDITFYPFTDNIVEVYRSLDLFVMPSHMETFGMVLIEAMSCGSLCMATEAGGPVEILEKGKAGILVEPKSPEALYRGIRDLMMQPKNYEPMKAISQKRIRDFYSLKKLNNQLDQIFKERSSDVSTPSQFGLESEFKGDDVAIAQSH